MQRGLAGGELHFHQVWYMNTKIRDGIIPLPLRANPVARVMPTDRKIRLLRLGSLLLLLNNMSGHQSSTHIRLSIGPQCAIFGAKTSSSVFISSGEATVTGVTEFGYLVRTSTGGQGQVELTGYRLPGMLAQRFSFSARLNGVGIPMSDTVGESDPAVAVVRFGPNSHTPKEGSTGRLDWRWQGPDAALQVATLAPALRISCQ